VNNFDGSIPKEFGNLSKLETLSLFDNQLSGSIPAELGKLSFLNYVDIHQNRFTGSIPSEFESLNRLEHFNINYNDFCGDVPKLSCDIESQGNPSLGKKCPEVKVQQNNNTNNDTSKNNGTDGNKKSQGMILIIVGAIAILLILLILILLAYIKNNKKVKNDKKVKTNDKSFNKKDKFNYTLIEDKYFEWKIENWDQLKDKEYSSVFDAHEHLWKLMLITNSFNEDNKESVDIGLSICDEIDNNDYIYVNFIIYFRNYNNNQLYKAIEYDKEPTFYSAKSLNHGMNNAILKSELYDKINDGCSLLENNKIIIGVLIKFYTPS